MDMNHGGGRERRYKPRDLCERTACPTYIQPLLALLLVFTEPEGFVLAETPRNWCRRSARRDSRNSNQSPTILPPSSPLIANGWPKVVPTATKRSSAKLKLPEKRRTDATGNCPAENSALVAARYLPGGTLFREEDHVLAGVYQNYQTFRGSGKFIRALLIKPAERQGHGNSGTFPYLHTRPTLYPLEISGELRPRESDVTNNSQVTLRAVTTREPATAKTLRRK